MSPESVIKGIRRETMQMVMAASRDTYPNEFAAALRVNRRHIITELIMIPGTISGNRKALMSLYNLPIDFSIIGSVHSHPSGNYHPSDADLKFFSSFGRIHIIVGYPYDLEKGTWAAYNRSGERIELLVLE